jgi:uridine kinase
VRDGDNGERQSATWPLQGAPLVIGIAGGSGSGKTTIAAAVVEEIGPGRAAIIELDSYYQPFAELPLESRVKINFDHPDSLDFELLTDHVARLRGGENVEVPVYDFSLYTRAEATTTVHPSNVIILEGLLVLTDPALRDLMDLKIYVDTDADIRLLRRLERDIAERGRSVRSVLDQYQATVRPMHLQFVEPSKRYSDLIIPEGYNPNAVGTVISMIRQVLASE